MAIKELQTRIQLKHDSYSAWTTAPGKDLVLLPGELGICSIGDVNQGSNVVPTVLFKVGDGTSTFEQLPWASAKAADVYQWAKASDVVFNAENKTITFVGGALDAENKPVDKVLTLNYVTKAEVEAITNPLAARVADLEAALDLDNGGEGSVSAQLADITDRLDVIEGEAEGSIKKAVADAKDALEDYADQAEADAIAAAETASEAKVAIERARIDTLVANDAVQDGLISDNADAIAKEVEDREAADQAIEAKIGTMPTGEGAYATLVDGIAEAKQAGVDAANAVTTLENGKVKANADAISGNAAEIAQIKLDLAAETKAREDGDAALDERLDVVEGRVETFFALEEGKSFDEALDTLKEIQDYLNGEGTATDGIIGRVAAAEKDIDDLQAEFADGGRVVAVEAAASANAGNITTLQELTSGYTGEGAIKAAVDAAAALAQTGVDNAATAQAAAEAADGKAVKAQEEVDALEGVVAGVKTTAEDAQTRVAAVEPKVEQAEKDIDALEAIVKTGDDSNANLRSAITDLQTLTGDANKGNEKLRSDLDTLAGVVNNETTGLAATKAIADQNKTDIGTLNGKVAAIEGDYLKAADYYVFNCGTSNTVTHVVSAEA